jgi:hypothetical protein
MVRNRNSGRIRPDQREADDNVLEIIGADIQLAEVHQQGLDETNDHKRRGRTTDNYRNRINHIYTFIDASYPEYAAAGGIHELAEDELPHHHKNKKDLKYSGLNVGIIMAFLASKKNKSETMLQSFTNMRKYHDAILYGAEKANEQCQAHGSKPPAANSTTPTSSW